MEIAKLRAWCRDKMQSVPEPRFEEMWKCAEEDGLLEEYVVDVSWKREKPEEQVLEYLKNLRKLYDRLRRADEGKAPLQGGEEELQTGNETADHEEKKLRVWLSEASQERAQAVAALLARSADKMDAVRDYRGRRVGKEPVDTGTMTKLIESIDERADGREDDAAELLDLTMELRRTLGWSGGQTIRFLYTGRTPPFEALSAKLVPIIDGDGHRFEMIQLTVAPWARLEDVANTFRNLQREVLGSVGRRGGKRNLKVFRFVEEHRDWDGKRPPWRKLLEAWNREHGEENLSEEAREKQVRTFSRDYRHARETMRTLIDGWENRSRLEALDDEVPDDLRAPRPEQEREAGADRGADRSHRTMARRGETIGFDGPLAWLSLDEGDAEEAVRATGHGLSET